MAATNSPFQRRYPPEMRERAVRMVREAIAESGERVGAVSRVARQPGIGPESVRNGVKQADIQLSSGNSETLPSNPSQITISVQSVAGSG